MKVKVYDFTRNSEAREIGFINCKRFNAQKLFELCNYQRSEVQKPSCIHIAPMRLRGGVGHGIAFQNPANGQIWLAKSVDWFVGTMAEVEAYAKANADKEVWL